MMRVVLLACLVAAAAAAAEPFEPEIGSTSISPISLDPSPPLPIADGSNPGLFDDTPEETEEDVYEKLVSKLSKTDPLPGAATAVLPSMSASSSLLSSSSNSSSCRHGFENDTITADSYTGAAQHFLDNAYAGALPSYPRTSKPTITDIAKFCKNPLLRSEAIQRPPSDSKPSSG